LSEGAERERRQNLIKLASAAAFVAVAVVLVLIVLSANSGSGGDTKIESASLVDRDLRGIPQEGTVLGDPGARVRLIEFGDLQCPVCKGFSEGIVNELIAGPVSAGEAKIDFRNFTIISSQSVSAGAAAIAAGKQGRGWNYIDTFYRNQGEEASGYVTDAFMTSVARAAGVSDIARWNTDRKSSAVLREVADQTKQAEALGFTGTPSFAVQGPSGKLETIESLPGSAAEIESAIQQAS
jgi:protein-disulfide isomerase